MLGNPSEGVNIWLRDTHLGCRSEIWETMKRQQAEDSVTDICVLFTRCIRRNNKDYATPILAKNVIGGYKALPLGEEVVKIIVNTEMEHCAIVQYSINANQIGEEEANNRLSMVVYAHYDEPRSKQNAILLVGDELEEQILRPINNLLESNDAYIGMSNYDDRAVLWNRKDLAELLIACSEGCRFRRGHFYEF